MMFSSLQAVVVMTLKGFLYPTETGALQWLFSPAGAGEKGNASRQTRIHVVFVASSASLWPPLLSVYALSSLLPTQITSPPVFTQPLGSFLSYTLLSVCTPPSLTFARHQDRRMLERRMAELEEELKVRRYCKWNVSCPQTLCMFLLD